MLPFQWEWEQKPPPHLYQRLKDERLTALQRKLEKARCRWRPQALLPHINRTATHISKLVVPEVGLVTLEQLHCKVTVVSIAFLQERS